MITNNQEKIYRSLKSSKGRKEHGLFLAEGRKVINELLQSEFEVETILSSSADGYFANCIEMSQKQIDRVSALKNPSSEIAIVKNPNKPVELEPKGPIFLLENIQDPGNLGTMFRTLRWFGAGQVLVSADCADVFNPKVIQASMGAVFHLNVVKAELLPIIETLRNSNYQVFSTEMDGDPALMDELSGNVGIVIGNEGHGISREILAACDASISIPGSGKTGTESLNAAISLSILAFQLFKNSANG